eukprot:221691_1
MADELKQTNQDYTDEEELEFIDSKFFVDLVDALVPALSAFDQEHDTKIYAKCIAEFVGGTFEEEFCSDSAFGHGVKDNPFHETMLKVKLLEDGSVIARDTYCDRNRASEFDAIGTYLINAAVLHKTERIYDLTILMVVNGHDINGVQHEDATIQLKCRLIHCIQEGTKSLSIVARIVLSETFEEVSRCFWPKDKVEQVPWNENKWTIIPSYDESESSHDDHWGNYWEEHDDGSYEDWEDYGGYDDKEDYYE